MLKDDSRIANPSMPGQETSRAACHLHIRGAESGGRCSERDHVSYAVPPSGGGRSGGGKPVVKMLSSTLMRLLDGYDGTLEEQASKRPFP
jgi:hypothetical protein